MKASVDDVGAIAFIASPRCRPGEQRQVCEVASALLWFVRRISIRQQALTQPSRFGKFLKPISEQVRDTVEFVRILSEQIERPRSEMYEIKSPTW